MCRHVTESPLFGPRGNTNGTGAVADAQQSYANTNIARRLNDTMSQLIRVVVRPTIHLMMDVVKLADSGHATKRHLQEGKSGNGANGVWSKSTRNAIHRRSPRPKVVISASHPLDKAANRTLEGMGVRVHQSRDDDLPRQAPCVVRLARSRPKVYNTTVFYGHIGICDDPFWRQHVVRPQDLHGSISVFVSIFGRPYV
jgi:hypothetical protein